MKLDPLFIAGGITASILMDPTYLSLSLEPQTSVSNFQLDINVYLVVLQGAKTKTIQNHTPYLPLQVCSPYSVPSITECQHHTLSCHINLGVIFDEMCELFLTTLFSLHLPQSLCKPFRAYQCHFPEVSHSLYFLLCSHCHSVVEANNELTPP